MGQTTETIMGGGTMVVLLLVFDVFLPTLVRVVIQQQLKQIEVALHRKDRRMLCVRLL